MMLRRRSATCLFTAVAVATVAGCTSAADGNGTPASTASATSTVTGSPVSPSTSVTTGPATAPATTTPQASGPGLCTPTVMTFGLGEDSYAGGTTSFSVIATNASNQPCVTTGYPGVALLTYSGAQVLQADRDPSTSSQVTTITVQPGQRIAAIVVAQDLGASGGVCILSPAFLITLPDNTDSTTIKHSTPSCQVSVQPFTPYTGP